MPYASPCRQIRLPNLFDACPMIASTNPYYKEAAAESRAWINSYDIFNDRKRAFFIQAQNELLCSYVYPYAGYEQFRTTCDLINLLFAIDEISDEQNGIGARETGQVFVNSMKHSGWDDGSILAQITREFRDRFLRLAGPRTVQRFNHLCEMYAESVATEAELRERGEYPDLNTFIPIRRNNSGVPLSFSIVEYILGIDLEDEVYEDPTFSAAYWAACDHVCWANDLYSYDAEQSRGQTGNNGIAILAKEKGLTLQQSVDFVGAKFDEFMNTYLDAKANLSLALGSDAARFVEAIGCWMIGNLMWSFETTRYFGSRGQEIKETGIVILRPREIPEDHLESADPSDEK
ncbi:hypothetical protein D9619_000148 [Psilocybe cf. subviscida]|uniref:Terpene synthase n=1 Tax=Psilocybe cf. subviscida TaxID=2480587 RepID=A0A8H5BFI5_9AGAR|nr:hypothetical protein D9619_000148 [Psilocybe cf. subviscida]